MVALLQFMMYRAAVRREWARFSECWSDIMGPEATRELAARDLLVPCDAGQQGSAS